MQGQAVGQWPKMASGLQFTEKYELNINRSHPGRERATSDSEERPKNCRNICESAKTWSREAEEPALASGETPGHTGIAA